MVKALLLALGEAPGMVDMEKAEELVLVLEMVDTGKVEELVSGLCMEDMGELVLGLGVVDMGLEMAQDPLQLQWGWICSSASESGLRVQSGLGVPWCLFPTRRSLITSPLGMSR